jgi:hypothetical protein
MTVENVRSVNCFVKNINRRATSIGFFLGCNPRYDVSYFPANVDSAAFSSTASVWLVGHGTVGAFASMMKFVEVRGVSNLCSGRSGIHCKTVRGHPSDLIASQSGDGAAIPLVDGHVFDPEDVAFIPGRPVTCLHAKQTTDCTGAKKMSLAGGIGGKAGNSNMSRGRESELCPPRRCNTTVPMITWAISLRDARQRPSTTRTGSFLPKGRRH